MTTQATLETWEMKAKRLALAVKAARPTDEATSAKERLVYASARYELQRHLERVEEGS